MKKFIVGLIFLFVVSGYGYAQSTLVLQEKCAGGAKEFFIMYSGGKFESHDDWSSCFTEYKSHYNKRLDKCFILVSDRCYKKGKVNDYLVFDLLADPFSHEQYMSFLGSGEIGEEWGFCGIPSMPPFLIHSLFFHFVISRPASERMRRALPYLVVDFY